MSKQFITPVSMKVTKEQYERDLKEFLKELGYISFDSLVNFNESDLLATNFASTHDEYGTSSLTDGKTAYNRTYIDHYNPELFLALAAMTEGDKPIVGEYVIASIGTVDYLVKYNGNNNKYEVTSHKWKCLANSNSTWVNTNDLGSFTYLVRKATKEELIKHMSMKEEEFVLPEKWYITVTNENKKVINDWKVKQYYNDNLFEHSYLYVKNNGAGEYDFSTEITFEQFKKYVLKEEDMIEEEKESRFPFKLTPEDAQSIIDIAYSAWKDKLAKKWATDIVLNRWIDVSYIFYKEMRKACTKEQHELFDKIFGKDTLECVFKQGEYIVYDNRTYHIETTNDGQGRVQLRSISFEDGRTIRFVTVEEINRNAHLWSINDTKDGEPVWVKFTTFLWEFRYSNGKNDIYANQKKSGNDFLSTDIKYKPFDPFNLPYNE